MTPLVRAVTATAIYLAAIAQPLTGHAESLVRSNPEADFTAYLPPVTDVPWLKDKAGAKRATPLFDAGSVSALLWMPIPVSVWPPASLQAAGLAAAVRM